MMAGGGAVKNLFSNVFSNEPTICRTSKSSNSQYAEQSALVKVSLKTYPVTFFEEDGSSTNLRSSSQGYDLWQVQLFLNHQYLSEYKIYQTVDCIGTDVVLSVFLGAEGGISAEGQSRCLKVVTSAVMGKTASKMSPSLQPKILAFL